MRKIDPLILLVSVIVSLVMAGLAFIALSEHRIYLCGKYSDSCSLHLGLSADFLGLVFLGVAIFSAVLPIKESRYWPFFYVIPAIYGVCAIAYLAVKAF